MQTERLVAANPQTKPTDLGCESAGRLHVPSSFTIAITQPKSLYDLDTAVRVCSPYLRLYIS